MLAAAAQVLQRGAARAAGLLWWNYKDTVPPLPNPGTVNPAFAGYGWRYDPNWRPTTYSYNNMDQAGEPHAGLLVPGVPSML